MISAPSLACALAVTCAVACGGPNGPNGKASMFERVWTRQAPAPPSSGALGNATLDAGGAIVLAGEVLDPATGAVRWTPAGAAVGFDGAHVIVARLDGDRWTAIERRAPIDGALAGEARLRDAAGAEVALRAFNARLALAPDRVVYRYLGRTAAYALDGAEAWTAEDPGDGELAINGDLVGLAGDGELVVRAAADGAARWRAPFDGGLVAASPRGGFFVSRGEQVVELDGGGREVRTVAGRFGAADGDLVVTAVGRDLVVFDGGGAELARVAPRDAADYLAAPALCGRALVYFRKHDATVWWRSLGGAERPVVRIEDKVGATDRGVARAGATLTEPPRCVPPLLLVQDWYVSAYRIPAP